jgi:dsDNA-specific endonuclease/ATPase MutS2
MGLLRLLRRLFGPGRRGADGTADHARAPRSSTPEDDKDVDPFDPFPEPVRLEITDVFDLHPVPPRQVRAVVEEYLREARSKGFRSVRIIHGKGVGVQRETVRAVLTRTPFVEHFSDAPPEAGGWGATIAHLRHADEGG